MKRPLLGFSLIELMIALVIVGILASVAMPSYQSYMRKGRRADVQQFMLNLSQLNQRYFMDNRAYTSTVATLASPPSNISSYYTVTITVDNGPPPTFSISAAPVGGSVQAGDTCGTLTLTSANVKSSSSGSNCW